jgi:hypothetical protein
MQFCGRTGGKELGESEFATWPTTRAYAIAPARRAATAAT